MSSPGNLLKETQMRRMIVVRCGLPVAVLGWLAVAIVTAQPLDKRTFFAFGAPVEVPGVVLPPGKYLFRIADPDSGGKVVQVLSADGTKPYALFFAVPAERPTPASEPEVRFMETPEGTPPAIKTWWYAGERTGREFIYPKEQARRLAKSAAEPVLTTQRQTTRADETNTTDLSRISSSGVESVVNAGSKPAPSTPGGATQQGEAAPSSISIK
jgi:hypothetical protein